MQSNIDEARGHTAYQFGEVETKSIIKVLGVGGGGGNAVSTMYTQNKIKGVTYLLCNTDQQALDNSGVPHKIVLGPNTTKGLGAGNKPHVARAAAEESLETIKEALTSDATQMVFVTAGMGGGTGTGAAPIIGKAAQEAGLLTVGIVTIPFQFEGPKKIYKALEGVNEMRQHVDALLVVNNERLLDVYKDCTMSKAFDYADATLSNAARGISDMINNHGRINLDFRDVQTTLERKGIAVISSGVGTGNQRLEKAIQEALNSPLLNNNNVLKATHVLLGIYSASGDEHELKTDEMEMLTRFTDTIESDFESKWGYYLDDTLEGGAVRVTLLASGFDYETTYNSLTGKEAAPLIDREEEKHRKELERQAETFYGKGSLSRGNKSFKRPLLLTLSELDNSELIAIADETPAYGRDLRFVEQIRQRYEQRLLSEEKLDEVFAPHSTSSPATAPSRESSTPEADNTIYF